MGQLMTKCSVSPIPQNALLVFVDIVDSSVHSSIVGTTHFAGKVLRFQELFEDLGSLYFKDRPYLKERVDSFCEIMSRGDEGLVFLVDPKQKAPDLAYKAVKFALELKARFKMINRAEADLPPHEMKVAAGIRYGQVSFVTKPTKKEGLERNLIEKIIGYSINYAKRVETSSRIGKFSQVFLSSDAAKLLAGSPIVMQRHRASLRGIQSDEEVYEVRSAFLEDIPMLADKGTKENKASRFLAYLLENYNKPEWLGEPWARSFLLSAFDSAYCGSSDATLKEQYHKRRSWLAWQKFNEDDPILLYYRAVDCEQEGKYSRAVSYLRKILEDVPHFIFARTKLVEACYEIIESEESVSADFVFVRDTAEELLEKYQHMLLQREKDTLGRILQQIGSSCNT